ncbi:MAG: hypothetical protein C0467_15160 [Planctomycetaceae bacterium]|nr:hypothetical protein [Planctomycetaceae bacterium]
MSQTYSPDAPPTSRTRILLLVVWAALTAVAVGFVFTFGSNAPYADEWEFVPALLGEEPVGPWFWKQHNEHRMVLPRLIYHPLFQITHDFRVGMLLQVALLSAMALGLMTFAARLRGRAAWPDVFFPVSLLHLGHWENFIMGYQICFALFTVFVTGLVVVAMQATRETAFSAGVRAGVLAFLVALTGGSGLVAALPVVAWLIYLAVIVGRTGDKRKALTLVGLALLPVVYIAFYFVGYEKPPLHPPLSRDPVAVVMVTGEVLAMAMGVGVSGVWWGVFAAELFLAGATVVLLYRQTRGDKTSLVGLIAVGAGVFGVALAIGFGRGSMGTDMGLWSRYAFLAWPLLGAMYLVWAKAGRKWVPMLLCFASALAFTPNLGTGMLMGSSIREHYDRMEIDSFRGVPAEGIVARNFPNSPNEGQTGRAVLAIKQLQAANVGIYAGYGSVAATDWDWFLPACAIVLLAVAGRWGWHLIKAVLAERARELFRLQHERYEEQLVKAAAATGLPRGLRWVSCRVTGDATLARDLVNGGIAALVPVVVQFEPEVGSDMEENPMAREPRPATAVFAFYRGTWTTTGRVVFNHTPDQTVAAFGQQFRVIHHGHH